MAENKRPFRGEISENDIEKESMRPLRPSEIDEVAGGGVIYAECRPAHSEDSIALMNAQEQENRAPARDTPDTEGFILDSKLVK